MELQKLVKAMSQSDITYVSLNRRLIAAMLELTVVAIFLFPVMQFVNTFIFGDRVIEVIIAELTAQHGENIPPDIFFSTLASENFFSKYFLSQSILLFMVAVYTISFWYKFGSTPGKLMLGCKIIDAKTLEKPSLSKCIARFCCYALSALPLFAGFFMMEFNKSKMSLHDYLCGTRVVKSKISFEFLRNLQLPFFSKQR